MTLPAWLPLNSALARPLVPRLVRWRVPAHLLTGLCALLGVAGGWTLARGTRAGFLLGCAAFVLANLLDECDGAVARRTGTSSGLGSWLDVIADAVVHAAFFAGLGVGWAKAAGLQLWTAVGAAAAAGALIALPAYVGGQVLARGKEALRHPDPPAWQEGRGAVDLRKWIRLDFSWLALISAAAGKMGWILWGGALGSFLFWIPAALWAGLRKRRADAAGKTEELNRDDAPAARRTGGRRWQLIGWIVGVALFSAILWKVDLSGVGAALGRMGLWGFGAVLLFYVVIFGLDTLGWRFALRRGQRAPIGWPALFRVRLAGEAVNYVTPTSFIGGEPVKALLLQKRHGVSLQDGIASVVIAKTTFAVSMMLFIGVGLVGVLLSRPLEAGVARLAWGVFAILSGLIGLFFLVQFFRPFHRANQAVKWLVPEWVKRLESKVLAWDEAILSFYQRSPGACLGSLGCHFLGWAAGAVEVYLIFHLLQIPVSFPAAWGIEALWVLLRSGAFLIPGTLGASEGAALMVCMGFGIPAVPALAVGLVRRARELTWMGLGLVEFARAR